MKYVKIEAKTYEDAVKKAKDKYGNRFRILSKRDIKDSGFLGFGTIKKCELTCFLIDEPEIVLPKEQEQQEKIPDKESEESVETIEEAEEVKIIEKVEPVESVVENKQSPEETEKQKAVEKGELLLERAKEILKKNDFSQKYTDYVISEMKNTLTQALPAVPTQENFEISLIDKIIGTIKVNHDAEQTLSHISVVLGPASAGKTTVISKLAGYYSSLSNEMKKTVSLISLGSTQNSYEQLKKVANAIDIPVAEVTEANEISSVLSLSNNRNIILIDTKGLNLQDSVINGDTSSLISLLQNNHYASLYVVIPAGLKNSDIDVLFKLLRSFDLSGVIVTKLDETSTVGNIISVCYDFELPILFTTEGKRIPKDINKVSETAMVSKLKGFGVNINKILGVEP